jgi:capsular exopolysaccharide synthesis family protein
MADPSSADFSQQWGACVRLVRRRFWTILTFLTITVVVVVAGTWTQTPVYRASATVLIDMETPNVLEVSTARDASTLSPSNALAYEDYYRTQLQIIKSRTIAGRVLANLHLNEQPTYASASDPIRLLLGQVEVEPVQRTRLARIHVEDPSPQQAARIANEFAAMFAEENLAKAMANEAMTLMKNEYIKLQSRETELSKRYRSMHPTMVRLRQEKEQLGRAIEQEMKRQLYLDRQQAEGGSPVEEVARPLLERLKDSSLVGSLRPNNVRIQELAQTPLKPIAPRKELALALGLLLGLIGGVAVAAIQDSLDSSLKVPEDVEQNDGLVLLGYVPRIDGMHGRPGSKAQPQSLFLQEGRHAQAAEAYRTIRTSLLYAAPVDHARAIVVTSPGAEEGKTTTVTHLGIALAQSGAKVLLVDADLRRGRLHELFHLKRKPGLSEVLVGRASFEAAVQPTDIPGLSVVVSGSPTPNPAELISSMRMREFLNRATRDFERILLDTPPAIALTEGVVLAAMTETVVVVAQSGKTPRQTLHRLMAMCHGVHAKVLGVVLNNVPPRDAPTYARYSAYRYASTNDDNDGPHRPSHRGQAPARSGPL